MTTSTATLPIQLQDYARSNGMTSDQLLDQLFSQLQHANLVDNRESITCESKRTADEVFGPEIVAPKAAKVKQPSVYRDLQGQCKGYGLKANGSTALLKDRLEAHLNGTATPDMYVKVKTSKPRTPKAAKKTVHMGLSYRQTQRAVKWFRDNMPSNLIPAMLNKNTGWDNVAANLDMLLTSHGWAARLQDRNVQQLCDYIGLVDAAQLETFLNESGLA
jgi:hypothetical protein